MKISDLDTPALLIDLDRVEANLRRWQKQCDTLQVRNRPHIKTHKIPELAKLQVELGAVGVTCQKLGEAEAMADGGITKIFLPYNIVGEAKLERLFALHQRVDLRGAADSLEVVEGLERTAARAGKPLEVMVECDTGMNRIGVGTPLAAVDLAVQVAERKHLRFVGFCTYPWSAQSAAFMAESKRLCAARNLEVPEISGGGTPWMWDHKEWSDLTEYRVGTYIYNDRLVVASGAAAWDDCAMTLLVTVVSRAGEAWVTVDGGTKTFSSDQYGLTGFGVLLGDPETTVVRCSEEHGVVQKGGAKPDFAIGEKIRIIPNHSCIVSNLHDVAYIVRGEEVIGQWQITARGKLQ